MLNTEAVNTIARHRADALVVVTMTTIYTFPDAANDPLVVRCAPLMGGASAIALGLALARPDRRVLALDGDGSLLMQLGSLATIAEAAPKNLVHFVFHNALLYERGGRVPIANGAVVDFPGLALAAGYVRVHSFRQREELDAALPEVLPADGPSLVHLAIEPTDSPAWSNDNPQGEIPDWWFTQMGDDARKVRKALQPRRPELRGGLPTRARAQRIQES